MPPLDDRPMSALALGTYLTCPLRFRYRYVDRLYWSKLWSATEAERKAVERGQDFHLIASRLYAGVEPGRSADPVEQRELDAWVNLLQGFLPLTLDRAFYPELELRLNQPRLKLQAKFDLLVVDPDGRATIFDWKTEKQMPKRSYLLTTTQTLLYRFMLCAAGGAFSPRGRFRPQEIAMIYWNPLHPHRWERLDYSEAQFEQDEWVLQDLVSRILRTPPDGFLATSEERICPHCEYRVICHGRRADEVDLADEEELFETTLSWDTLPELP